MKASPRGVGTNVPATTESIVWLTVFGGVGSEVPVFTPSDFNLSESEDMSLFYPQTSPAALNKKSRKIFCQKIFRDRILNELFQSVGVFAADGGCDDEEPAPAGVALIVNAGLQGEVIIAAIDFVEKVEGAEGGV